MRQSGVGRPAWANTRLLTCLSMEIASADWPLPV